MDVYSGIAILFVVILHSNAYYLANILKLNSYIKGGILLNFVDKVVHISVPMFIFIAGYKYMMNNKKDTYHDYFMKKIRYIFKPFFIISTFYLCYHWTDVFFKRLMYTGVYDIHYVTDKFVIGFLKMFMGYNFAYQLWYIPMYLLICVTYPVFYKHIKNTKLRLLFFLCLAMLWEVIVLLHIPFLSNNPYPLVFIYYFFIYEIGCLFYTYKLHLKSSSIPIILYILMLFVMCTIKQPIYNRLVYELIFTPVAVIAYYYIALSIRDNFILKYIGQYSFFIYLFHEPLVLSNFSRFLLRHGLYKSYFMTVFLAIISIIFSVVIYKLISIGFLRKAVFSKNNVVIKNT